MMSVLKHRRTDVKCGNEVGKCCLPEDDVYLFDGRRKKFSDMVGQYFVVPSIDEKFQVVPAVAYAEDNGTKEVVRITTSTGREITRTLNHKLFVANGEFKPGRTAKIEPLGWVESGKIKEGDLVAVPTELLAQGGLSPVEDIDLVRLAAYMIGDGGTSGSTPTFTQEQGKILEDFKRIVIKLGCSISQADKYLHRITGQPGTKYIRDNTVINLSREWEIWGKRCNEKEVPEFIWMLPKEQLRIFLSCLYSTDGWAYSCSGLRGGKKFNKTEIGYSSTSQQLIKDIFALLLRFGITASIRKRRTSFTSNGVRKIADKPSWTIDIRKRKDILIFAEEIGIYGKEDAVEACRKLALEKRERRSVYWEGKNISKGFHWERVKNIERLGETSTVSISVIGTHTFLTTFVEHNTYGLAMLSLWFLYSFGPNCSVVVTSSTDRQLWRQFWTEVKQMWYGRKVKLGGRMLEKFLEIRKESKWFMVAFSTKEEATFEGWHNDNILLIFDEAKGIPDSIWRGGERLLRGKGGIKRWVVAGTPPLAPIGEFCQISLDPRKAANWNHLTCSGWESENVSDEACEEARLSYGEDSPFYQSMVLGRIPDLSSSTLISLADVESAAIRTDGKSGEIELGVDVARQGDDETVVVLRNGWHTDFHIHRGKDRTTWCMGRIKSLIGGYQTQKQIPIKVDDTGVGCVTRETEILTVDGWRKADDIKPGDGIYSKDKNGKVVIESVTENVLREKTRILKSGDIEFAHTHFLPYKTRTKHKYKLKPWEEVLDRKYIIFDNDFEWECGPTKDFIIPRQTGEMPNGGEREYKTERTIRGVDFCSFLGWFISEGYIDKNSIGITQSVKSKHNEQILDCLGKINKKITSSSKAGREYTHKFNDKWLAAWLTENCYLEGAKTCPHIRVPDFIKSNSKEAITAFLDSFLDGDGYLRRGKRHYVTSSKVLRDDLMELMLKIGIHSNWYLKEKEGSITYIHGRKVVRKNDVYCIFELGSKTGIGHIPKQIEEYYDNVRYIRITGDTKLFLNRFKEGRHFWTHNGGVTDLLIAEGYNVVPINFGQTAEDPDFYYDFGTEMFAYLAMIFRRGEIIIPDDPTLKSQLYQRTQTEYRRKGGKIVMKLLSKEELRKKPEMKGMKSPDRADALALAFSPSPLPIDGIPYVGTSNIITGVKGWR